MGFTLHRPSGTAVRIHVVPSLPASWMSIKKPQEKSQGQNLAIFLRFGKNLLLQLVTEFVSDAPYGGQGPVGVILDLFPETFDMYVHGTGVSDVFVAPDMV